MRRKTSASLILAKYFVWYAALGVLLPALVQASGGEGHGAPPSISTLLLPALNFSFYVALVLFCYWKFGRAALSNRSTQIAQQLDKSAALLAEAEDEFAQLKQRLAQIAAEKTEVIRQFEHEGQNLAQTITAHAEKSAAELKKDAQRRIMSDLSRAKAEIREEIVARATVLAKQRLLAELSAEEDSRLRQDLLQD